uniref:Nucleoprotein TPR n=1 Tax=Panagrolaimus superbus TaxID=310955 RepID=A0A914XXK4_9BILA
MEEASSNDGVKVKLAELERENFVLKEQLNESKQNVERVNKENDALKTANQTLEKSALEKSNNYLHIDKERETLLVDKARYQSENTQLKHQKELLEAQTTRLLSEKRSLTEDIQSVKDDYQKALHKIAKLQTDIDDFQSEKALLAHDKERWAQEKELYGKNREWYMNELADRDKAISSLRLQIVQLERDITIKSAELGNTVDEFTLKNESLTARLGEQEEECRALRERNTELKNENRTNIDNISAELQVKERLIHTYKEEVESLKAELECFKSDETELREALSQKDAALIAVNDEIKRIADEASQQAADREIRIIQLQDELDKANELLKFGTSGLPGSDISAFSASAAELLSSGTSLSSIYAQHSKVLAELAEEKQKQKDLEDYVRTILNDLKKNAPNVLLIRKENDSLHVENDELRRQLKNAFDERDHLRTESSNVGRELKFTRTELLSAQHENSTLKKQVQKLLYVAEQSAGHFDPDISSDDVAVFSNIRELHERNIELIQQLEELKRSNEESVKQARQEEIESLHLKLSEFSHEIEMLRDSQEKTSFIINQLENQRDGYKEELEHRQRSPMKSLNNSRNFVEPDTNNEWKIKFDKLDEQIRYIVNDKQKTEEALNERVNSQMELISQLRVTNGRIESDLEYQKKNQETAFKKVNEFEKEISKKNEQIAKHKAQLTNDEQRIQKLTNELFQKQDELTKLSVNLRLLNEKYDIARNNAVSYEAQVKVLRENRYSAERTNLTLEGIENILKVKEKEKIEQMKSQLDVLMIERDNYRNAVEDLRSHSERRNMELQATLGEAVAAKDKLQIELKYHREQYSSLEQLLEKTQSENSELLKKFEELKSSDFSVDGLNKEIQQLRNKNLYHEKQLTEQRAQLDQIKARLEAKDKELEELQRLTGGFENTMKSQDELQQQQQTRLHQECKELTNELESARKTIEELNEKVFDAETRESNYSHTMDTLRHEYQSQIAEIQKSLANYQNQVEGKTKEITELLSSLQNAQSDRDNVDSRVKLLDDQLVAAEKQIAELKADLKSSNERFESASNDHDAMVSRLRNSVVLLEKEKARLNEELSELQHRDHEQKLNMDTLYDKIQSLTQDSLLNSQLDTSSSGLNTSQSGDNSLAAVVDILRKIKDKEMEMRMAAEIELSRIKAQAHIDEQQINQLSCQVEELNKQVQINGQLMNEKNELVNRLGSLQSVQRRNEVLQHELNDVRERVNALEHEIQRLNFELEKVSRAKESAESRYSATAQELIQVKKDLAGVRKRCSEAEKQITQNVASSPADTQKVTELENEKNNLTKKLAETTENMQKIKNLARKYRDEHSACAGNVTQLQSQIAKLEAEKKQIQEEALPPNMPYNVKKTVTAKQTEINNLKIEISALNEKINSLTATNNELKQQLEEAQNKANASSEMDMRVKSLTNAFNNIKNRTAEQEVELKQLKNERDQYKARVESLEAEKAQEQAAMPSESDANLISESSTNEPSTPTRKRTLQDVIEADFGVSSGVNAKKSRPEIAAAQQVVEEVSNDLVDLGEQSNDAPDRVPSVEQRGDEQMDEDIVPEDGDNIDFNEQDYYGGVQDAESFPEPPNLAHEEENNEDAFSHYEEYENTGLPNYPQDEEGDDTVGEEDYDEVEDDDDDADIHSEQPDEGEEFYEENNGEDDSDDDIVVLS